MDNELYYDYLTSMAPLGPEEEQLMRQQKLIDMLREGSMEAPKGGMVGNTFVAPSFTQHLDTLAKGYVANRNQKGVDTSTTNLTKKMVDKLDEVRKRRRQGQGMGGQSGYANPADVYSGWGNSSGNT